MEALAISGTRRAMKEMADGTIRVQVDIDPSCRADFLKLFPNIDMPVALAPLRADFGHNKQETKPKGGALAKLAGILCQSEIFHTYLFEHVGVTRKVLDDPGAPQWVEDERTATEWVRNTCGVTSRAELDHNKDAQDKFHVLIRLPFLAWKEDLK